MSGSALSDLSGLLALSRANELDLRPVILRVQTDLFVTAANRDRTTIAAFEALVSGLLPVVDDDTAARVARKLAPVADTPEGILRLLVERGGEARRAVIESACALGETLIEAASRDGADLAEMRAARADVTASEIAELVAREDAGADLALARNEAITLAASLDTLVERARGNADLAKALLARADLPAAHRAPLYIEADEAQRAAIRATAEPLRKSAPFPCRSGIARNRTRSSTSRWPATASASPTSSPRCCVSTATSSGTSPARSATTSSPSPSSRRGSAKRTPSASSLRSSRRSRCR